MVSGWNSRLPGVARLLRFYFVATLVYATAQFWLLTLGGLPNVRTAIRSGLPGTVIVMAAAAIHAEHRALRVDDWHYHRAVKVLMAAVANHAELLHPPSDLRAGIAVLLRQPVPERAVCKAQPEVREHVRMREPAALQIRQRDGSRSS